MTNNNIASSAANSKTCKTQTNTAFLTHSIIISFFLIISCCVVCLGALLAIIFTFNPMDTALPFSAIAIPSFILPATTTILPDNTVQLPWWSSSGEAAESSSPPANAPLVLVMGLPRSGSHAVHNYFACNNIASRHYCCDDDESRVAVPTSLSSKSSSAADKKQTKTTRFPCLHRTCGACVHDNLNHSRLAFANCQSSNTESSSTATSSQQWTVYAQFDVETGEPYSWFLPQHFALPLLHRASPDAIWILNQRGQTRTWATSVLHWYSTSQRLFHAFGLDYYGSNRNDPKLNQQRDVPIALPHKVTQSKLYMALEESIARASNQTQHQQRIQALMGVYVRHGQKVQDFVAQKSRRRSSHKLVELDVDSPNAGQVLAKAFPGTRASCWKFDASALDNDWKDFTLFPSHQ